MLRLFHSRPTLTAPGSSRCVTRRFARLLDCSTVPLKAKPLISKRLPQSSPEPSLPLSSFVGRYVMYGDIYCTEVYISYTLSFLEGATLKAGMTERRNHGMAESRNGGKSPQILKDGIAESRNGGKYPQILKDGMTENHPKS